MNTDIRLAVSFKNHRKRKRLRRLLGDRSDSYLIDLWLSVATDAPTGVLSGWDDDDIADACNWEEDPKTLIEALICSNWLEKNGDGEYVIHDWCVHQAWACKANERSEIARKAAETRWKKRYAEDAESNAPSMPDACGENAESNAPILSLPNKRVFSGRCPDEYHEDFELFWKEYPKRNGRKNGKRPAFQKWWVVMREGKIDNDFLIVRIKQLRDSYGEYAPDASVWFNQRRWEDEVVNQEKPTKEYMF